MKSRAKSGCLWGVIALCGLIVYFVWRARTAPTVAESWAQLSPIEQQQRRTDTKEFIDQARELQQSARRKEHKPFSLVVTEQVLNTLLQDNLKENILQTDKFQVRDLRAGLEPNHLILQGNVNYQSIDTTATLNGSLVTQNGELAYQAESLQLGRMNINVPDKVKQRAERTISKQLNSLLKKVPGQINKVTVEQDQLIIEGVTD